MSSFLLPGRERGDAYEGENMINIRYKTMKGENIWKKRKKSNWI